ncbi:SRPBCC family protein [Cryobacterium sp. HLT2-28]|uniref:SRPBCC family protein n=1 Tax=Cryobacterium sp. HLT2-28 TaxID=1259146 RepID=UPI001F53EB10|nr:SRPBCC family protein [Cryobacterium sp. HLT2-28]
MNNPTWRSGVRSIALASGRGGTSGAVYSQTLIGPGGRSIQGDYEITTALPGKELAFRVITVPARPTGRYLLTEHDGGTTVRFILDFHAKGLMKIMGSMITRSMQAEVAQLGQLKSVLEATRQ